MRFVIKFLIIGIGIYIGLMYCPWWIVVAVPFVMNLLVKTKGSGAFLSSFLGVSFGWFIATYTLYSHGAQEFTGKMAGLFYLPQNGLLLVIVSTLLMGFVGALSGFTANAFRNIFFHPKKKIKNKYGRPDYSQYAR